MEQAMRDSTKHKLRFVCDEIADLVKLVQEDTIAAARVDHVELIRHYYDLSDGMDRIKEARKTLENIETALSRNTIPDALRQVGVKSLRIDGVGMVKVSHKWSASIIPGHTNGAYLWLRDNKLGGIIKETVAPQTLAASAKAYSEEQGKDFPDTDFNVGRMAYTSITK
jgi:hypothetical protein